MLLEDAIAQSGRTGSRLSGLHRAAEILGGSTHVGSLNPSHGAAVLQQMEGLSPASVKLYYGELLRLIKLHGVDVTNWPKAPSIPRKRKREPCPDDVFEKAVAWLRRQQGWSIECWARDS